MRLSQVLHQFPLAIPPGNLLLAYPVKSRFVAVDSGHDSLLYFGLGEPQRSLLAPQGEH